MKKKKDFQNSLKAEDADNVIRSSIMVSLAGYSHVPLEKIIVTVKNGFVSLTGMVQWIYQKGVLLSMVQSIPGVRGVENNMGVINSCLPSLLLIKSSN
jgi:osmotically-inducible protein OsmY